MLSRYHTATAVVEKLQKQGCHIHFLGPYSWETSVCEYLFAWLKKGDLNPEQITTGKK